MVFDISYEYFLLESPVRVKKNFNNKFMFIDILYQ